MKMSNMLVSTLREVPAEAEIDSHKLMLRAGFIRKMAAGIYNYMPLGLKALKNVEEIVREEMNAAGAQEFLASAMLPAELWQESGRWDVYGAEMFRLKDRNNRDYCLGPTHEEVFTDIARTEIKSYKQLPVNLYQIQTEYRDERRPRFGVMRSREFVMKDAYSFDKDQAGLDASYDKMHAAYINIFNRCGIDAKCVEADSGAIGGSNSAEFMVKSEVGEDEIVFCSGCDYAANMEKAVAVVAEPSTEEMKELKEVHTPGVHTIEELENFFKLSADKFAKTLVYVADGKTVAVVVRGDREVNETKVGNAVGGVVEFELANEEVVKAVRSVYKKTLIVKLSPNVTDITEIARAAENGGADSVSLINTLLGMAVDAERKRPILSTVTGGMSGAAVKPIALRMVWQVAKAVKIPVIGLGGIMNWKDAVEFMLAGASAIQIGTANFIDPAITVKVAEGIDDYLNRHNYKSVKEIIGALEI